MTAGQSTLPAEKTRETCMVKVVQKDTAAKTVGNDLIILHLGHTGKW